MRWFVLLPFSQLFLIFAVLITPILPLFATSENKLPKWLAWFDTPDDPLYGDHGFSNEHAWFKGDPALLTRAQRYWNRCHWLWRNPAYGWDWTVLAYHPKPEDVLTVKGRGTIDGVPVVDDLRLVAGNLTYGGWFFARQGYAWQLYIRKRWSETHSTKLNFGWKLWSLPKSCQFVFSPTGFWKKIS